MDNLPSVSFVVLVESDADRLTGCLETINLQEYPEKLVETVVVDYRGGGEASEIARRFGVPFLLCEREDRASRINLGLRHTKEDLVFVIGSDGGLSRTDWIRMMVRPFIERPEMAGVFTQMVEAPTDSAFARYLCRLNGGPFLWFVHGDSANARYCCSMYGTAGSGDGYTIHAFPPRRPPLLPAEHGVGVRRSALPALGDEDGEAFPLIRIIEGGQPVAFVPAAGIHHLNAESLWLFLVEEHSRLRGGAGAWPACHEQHSTHRSFWRRARRYLFEVYGLTVIMPLLDGIWLSIMEKNSCMLWHGPAAVAESWLILIENVRRLMSARE